MSFIRMTAIIALGIGFATVVSGAEPGDAPNISVEQIVEKNAAARGGVDAWRRVQTIFWSGHIQSANAPMPSMQFVMEQQRPNRTRFEVDVLGGKTVRVFDGAQGWKAGGGRDSRAQARPFTLEEIRYAQGAQGIDGPLIDHAAKGISVTLQGLDELDGHMAYRLGVRLPTGEMDRIWVDARSFLELRYDRNPPVAGRAASRSISTRYGEYRSFDGLQIPTVIETGAATGPGTSADRMIIENVVINPPLEKWAFTNPDAALARAESARR